MTTDIIEVQFGKRTGYIYKPTMSFIGFTKADVLQATKL